MRRPTYRTSLTADETKQLEQLIRKSTAPQHLVRRAKIILMANGEGKSNQVIAEELGITSSKVSLWTKRWIDRAGDSLEERLSDLARPLSNHARTMVSHHGGLLYTTSRLWSSHHALDRERVSERSDETGHCR